MKEVKGSEVKESDGDGRKGKEKEKKGRSGKGMKDREWEGNNKSIMSCHDMSDLMK